MEKNVKLFWRYFGPALALLEISIYLMLVQKPFTWQFIRIAFMMVNAFIIAYLLQVKLKVDKHNAQIAAPAPKKSQRPRYFASPLDR
jgi:hypothetical protein